MIVELRAAKIPGLGPIAWHYWFVIIEGDRRDRWEVWQTAKLPRPHWGHLYQNLMHSEAGVGNGPSWLVCAWQQPLSLNLARTIESSPATYPYCHRYFYWPGPNSNTYVQWVLDQAQIPHRLSWQGWGKDFRRNPRPPLDP